MCKGEAPEWALYRAEQRRARPLPRMGTTRGGCAHLFGITLKKQSRLRRGMRLGHGVDPHVERAEKASDLQGINHLWMALNPKHSLARVGREGLAFQPKPAAVLCDPWQEGRTVQGTANDQVMGPM